MSTSAERLVAADRQGATPRMKDRIDGFDWTATPLGARADWPQSLVTALDVILGSGYAMCLAWGRDRTFLYNDAYATVLGVRHPDALGLPIHEVWPDIWADIAPLVARTFAGETMRFVDMPLAMTRHGYPEDTWWDFSYSPVHDEQGEVAGLLNVTNETTARIIAERDRAQAEAVAQDIALSKQVRERELHFASRSARSHPMRTMARRYL